MASFFLVIQIISLLITTRCTHAAHNSDAAQQHSTEGQPATPSGETPLQAAQQLPEEDPPATSLEDSLSGLKISSENAAPFDHAATGGDVPPVPSVRTSSQAGIASEEEEAAAGSSHEDLSEEPSLSSLSSHGTTFQCHIHSGRPAGLLFHHIIVRTPQNVFLDVESLDTNAHEVFRADFVSEAGIESEEGSLQAHERKSALIAQVKRETSLFPEGMTSDVLFADHGMVVPKYCCSLANAPDLLDVGSAQRPLKLLNLFVSMPSVVTELQSVYDSLLSTDDIVKVCVEMTRRLATLHSFNVVHRRISLRSFFIRRRRGPHPLDTSIVYLGNMSSAQRVTHQQQPDSLVAPVHALDPASARRAFSPLRGKLPIVVTKAQDAWSLGLALYSLMCNRNKDPYRIFERHASHEVLLRRIYMLAENPRPVDFHLCLPLTEHPSILWLRDLTVRLLDPNEGTRLLPENAISTYPHLFGDS